MEGTFIVIMLFRKLFCLIDIFIRLIYILFQRIYVFFFKKRGCGKIFMFHKINDNDVDEYTISVDNFEKIISKNKDSIRRIEDFERDGGIVLTFDDAYDDVYYNVRPILAEYGLVYYVFLCKELIGKKGYLNILQVKELIKDGNCVICSHLSMHKIYRYCSEKELGDSILECKDFLNKNFGIDNSFVAFPYGSLYAVSKKNVNVASKYYKYIFSTIPVQYNGRKVFGMYPRINVNNKGI